MSKHTDFILKSITEILQGATISCKSVGFGIEGFPLNEYVLQSVFLKMTGFQEQKMKCICWELATNDYEYRYSTFYSARNSIGECSCLDEKNKVYNCLIEQVRKKRGDDTYEILSDEKYNIFNEAKRQEIEILNNSSFSIWNDNVYKEFINISNTIQKECFEKSSKQKTFTLFRPKCDNCSKHINCKNIGLVDIFEILYRNRNRCAHNTTSYQHNLPTLDSLRDSRYKYENYFVWFLVLIYIDDLIRIVYKDYLLAIENDVWN